MKVIVSLASGANNVERTVMRAVHQGIELWCQKNSNEITALDLCYDHVIPACDLAVQFGSTKARDNAHHQVRQNIIKSAKHIVYIETPVIGRTTVAGSRHKYYRVGCDGFLNRAGLITVDDSIRAAKVREELNIREFTEWRELAKSEIAILAQLPGDASLRGQSMTEWLLDTVREIRTLTNRSIVIRLHPAMSQRGVQEFCSEMYPILLENISRIRWSSGQTSSLTEDLGHAGVAVTYSSGAAVDAILMGVPVISLDRGSLAWDVSDHWLDNVENPTKHDAEHVNRWINRLCNSQWSLNEMRDGSMWSKIYPQLKGKVNESNQLS